MHMTIDRRLRERAKSVRLIMMDVDGVLTDGRILYSADGTEIEAFYVRDGLGLRAAQRAGILTAVLTGRVSGAVARRAKELGIPEIHQGIPDKVETYETLLRRHGLTDEAVAYVGDDLNDLPLLARAGFSAAPADAAEEVKAKVAYVTVQPGGRGAVREVIELILKAQGKWKGVMEFHGPLAEGEAFS
jgi:3-deoxy-D-manno-octulosonate 8-phosphate phosphatase (KDO 8-P phosphatase)